MNELKIFENPAFGKVRVVEQGGEPWFVGKDIAEALGYSNPQKAIRDHVKDSHKGVNESFTVNGTSPILVDEAGVYTLVSRMGDSGSSASHPQDWRLHRWQREDERRGADGESRARGTSYH